MSQILNHIMTTKANFPKSEKIGLNVLIGLEDGQNYFNNHTMQKSKNFWNSKVAFDSKSKITLVGFAHKHTVESRCSFGGEDMVSKDPPLELSEMNEIRLDDRTESLRSEYVAWQPSRIASVTATDVVMRLHRNAWQIIRVFSPCRASDTM